MKNNKTNIALYTAIVSLLVNVGAVMIHYTGKKNIAYIRSSELVYGYLGMQEANRRLKEKEATWEANIDTLQQDFRRAVKEYSSNAPSIAVKEREAWEAKLKQRQDNLVGYVKAINEKAKEEDEQTTQGVLNQVNSFVEEYGKKHGYDVILGTTLSGSLLYGNDAIDITKEVLYVLNKNYKGEGNR